MQKLVTKKLIYLELYFTRVIDTSILANLSMGIPNFALFLMQNVPKKNYNGLQIYVYPFELKPIFHSKIESRQYNYGGKTKKP